MTRTVSSAFSPSAFLAAGKPACAKGTRAIGAEHMRATDVGVRFPPTDLIFEDSGVYAVREISVLVGGYHAPPGRFA